MAQLPRPAAVDVAAAEEDGAAWEDALDIDDSDLRLGPTFSSLPLRPSTAAAPHPERPSRSSHGQRIPGPVSAVQDARRLRESGISPVPGPADLQAADADFLLHPWLCTLQFLGKDRAWERPGIKRIKADRELDRAPLVVGVVTSCKPNELGDLFLTLKDPTDTISASVHRKVFSEGNVGHDISVGCVIVLIKVAVFRPSHTACYLNITQGKVVKVMQKDCDPPLKQDLSLEAKWRETQWFAHLGEKPLGTSEGTASISSKLVSRTKDSELANLHSASGTANIIRGRNMGLDKTKTVPCYSDSQQSLRTFNTSGNPGNWQERQGANLPIFERGEAEGSNDSIMMRLLDREKMLPSCKETKFAEISLDHNRTLNSSNSTSTTHTASTTVDGHPHQNFNILNVICSQPSPGGSLVIAADKHRDKASDKEKLGLPLTDEVMLPSSKKLKVLPDCYDATMNTIIDAISKQVAENDMDSDVQHMTQPSHGCRSCVGKPDECQQNDFGTANAGAIQIRKETPATTAAFTNGPLTIDPKKAVSEASVVGWTDEQLSELFADY